jgi:hypothetical protein
MSDTVHQDPSPALAPARPALRIREILRTWWPLTASWMLMGLEGPMVAAVVSRLPHPTVNLAAWGGVVFPLALMFEAPIIMMLAASTALSRDWASYLKLRRFMMYLGAAMTMLHVLVVATPLYYVIAEGLLGAPKEVLAPARLGLFIMIPWTWSIGYRRFHQGVLIRFGHALKVGLGTGVRFCADASLLAIGYTAGWPGIVVAACGMVAGVLSEAFYVHLAVRPTLRNELRPAPPTGIPLTTRAMLDFYIPLSLTQVLILVANPIGSAAISRMPLPLLSLAAWPVVGAVRYITGGFGGSYNEVVVALVERKRSSRPLFRFAIGIAALATGCLLVLTIPAVSNAIFRDLMHLAAPLPAMVHRGLYILLPMPAIAVAQSYFQGMILHSRRTRSITEAVLVFLGVVTAALIAGVLWGGAVGLYVALAAFTFGEFVRTCWLSRRSRHARRAVRERDLAPDLT